MRHARGRTWRWLSAIIAVLVLSSTLTTALAHGDRQRQGGLVAVPTQATKPLHKLKQKLPAATSSLSTAALAVSCSPQQLDLRVLVLTPPGTNDTTLPAIQQTLDYLGTPYTVVTASQIPGGLTADKLASGCHGFFQTVILTDSQLAYTPDGTNWLSALTNAEWQTLWAYEAAFKVRQVSWYTYPTPDYGFQYPSSAIDTSSAPLAATYTAAGRTAFGAYVNTANPLQISWAYTYLAKPLDAATVPWLVDGSGNVLAAVRTFPDGRENLALTFDSNPYLTHAVVLGYGIVSWATHGLFLGERHIYMSAQVDDLLIDNEMWLPATPCGSPVDGLGNNLRVAAADMAALKNWQTGVQNQATTSGFRLDIAFNGYGATGDYEPDDLTGWVQRNQSAFKWLNHTWDHENLDTASYSTAAWEIGKNIAIANQKRKNGGLELSTFNKVNLITPDVSGLLNASAMKAAYDLGVRYVVSDTSRPGYSNPTPNAGIYNQSQPGILMIPRRPNNLYFNVSTPAEWAAEYNCMYRGFWGRDLSYGEILDKESTVLLSYMLRGEMDPWMFHQPNFRAYDGSHSLLGDLLDMTLQKYRALFTLPIQSPTMDQLGQRMAARMAYNAAGVTASINPGVSITLKAQKAVTIPVTGLRKTGAELYGGQYITYVALKAGQSITIPLS